MRHLLRALAAASVIFTANAASAFCGFYVSGADAALYNNATEVVLMRDGTRTVLAMENNYEGPASDFAMVVPVPVVLQKENVKTLPQGVFDRVDKLAAPRLVEYWEQDPCQPQYLEEMSVDLAAPVEASGDSERPPPKAYGVKIEAKFSVGEYDILILSATDSMGLDAFLRSRSYKIPSGAEPYLKPYVQNGSKFFVAKVDVAKVKFKDGQAMLSPLRFHYDSDTFSLPVRLGLINSNDAQDLIVHVLARSRFEVANYENYAIPTNIDVSEATRENFGAFYAAMFDRMLALHPKAVITEYAWDAGSCDPCPEPPLEPSELATLGADALPAVSEAVASGEVPPGFASKAQEDVVDFVAEIKHMMHEEAKLEGKRDGRAATLLDLLAARFGKVPAAVRTRIEGADENVLSTWALRVLTAKRLAEVLDGEAAAPAPKARTAARGARKRH